jgi:hypothetical protein
MSIIKIEEDYLGMCLHTALRKLCDSAPTSIMWNVFDLLPRPIWSWYLDELWSKLKDVESKEVALKIIKEVSLDGFIDYDKRRAMGENTMQWMNLMQCSFKLFSDGDWEGYTYWLFEED